MPIYFYRPLSPVINLILIAWLCYFNVASVMASPSPAHTNPIEVAQQARALAAQGQTQAALTKSHNALTLMTETPKPYRDVLPYLYDDIASLNYQLKQFEQASEWANKAVDAVNKLAKDNPAHNPGHAHIPTNRAVIHTANARLDKVEADLLQSLAIYDQMPTLWLQRITTNTHLINLYLETEALDKP